MTGIGSPLSRRSFMKWSGALGGVAAVGGLARSELSPFVALSAGAEGTTTVIPTGCSNNCGGRCILRAHVKDGVITRIETDPDPDLPDQPQLRACLRGRSYRQIVYHPDRLKYPMKRVGKRGEGKFERISWDEATTTIANQVKRVNEQYGPLAMYVHYSSGISSNNTGTTWMKRLLGLYTGDTLGYYGTYSSGHTRYATPYTYGTSNTGNHRSDWQNSKLILLMGHNPAETVFGTNSMYYLRKAKEAGAKIIVVDPRYTDTAVAVADEWIPIRPGTDSALLDALAYVIITEGLLDQKFLDTYTVGFDEQHLPEGVPAGHSYRSYILGESADRTPKTPEWAAAITGIPADRIRQLGREYGSIKPGALIQGFGPQRHANGEQSVRSATVLPALVGNVGVKGGWAGGAGYPGSTITLGGIPTQGGKTQISCFIWTDAIVRGKEMTAKDDLIVGADKLPSNIKLVFNLAGNTLINQHSDINKTAKILQDESLCEFIVSTELFMTPSAKFSDIVLPGPSFFEREGIVTPWNAGEYMVYMPQILQPMWETRNDYDWIADVAAKLGVKDKFTEGKTVTDWLKFTTEATAKAYPDFPGWDGFVKQGYFKAKRPASTVAFEKFVQDPVANKLTTPSGKIEIFSKALYDRGKAATHPDRTLDVVPAIPKYVPTFDGLTDPLKAKYPLQMTGWHLKGRVHSTHDNNPWMREMSPQEMWINPLDAEPRSIKDGDTVLIFNDRGKVKIVAKVTPRIMPGVVAVPQGAWWKPDASGVDTNGSINVLTTQRGSYMSNSNPQHTNLVQVSKA